jgi:S-adenosylmethionine synthetase
VPERRIERGIRAMFPLTPWGIFEHLDLGRPIYRQAAAFGYFGWEEPDFTWERVDRVSALTVAG